MLKNRKWRHAKRAFTLIELLLVLVILATLAAIVIPKFTKRSEQARITAARTEISYIQGALDAFEVDTSRYPTTEEGLSALLEEPSDVTNWHGPYLRGEEVPLDPWGRTYIYQQPGDHNTSDYDLYSYGPNGQEGGDDDIDNWSAR